MKYLFFVLVLTFSINIYSEDDSKNETIISIDQERRETLLYGIDSEVNEIITTLTKEKIKGFNKELVNMLDTAFDDNIKISIYEYFKTMEISDGEDEAIKIFDAIVYEDEFDDKYAISAIKYLSSIKSDKAIKRVDDILESENQKIIQAALSLIGENSVISKQDKLLEMLEDEDIEDQTYLDVIKALGKIKSSKALDLLITIADDEDEEITVRNAVCFSLGEIGDKKALPVLKRCLGSKESFLLRQAAIEAIGKFNLKEIDNILMDSLRDPQWQIRNEAIIALGERKVSKAFDILRYKALKDPEVKIQKQAFNAIGDINSKECREFLKEIFTDDKYNDTQKTTVINKLIENNIEYIFPAIEELYNKKNAEKRKPVLDSTLALLAKKEYKFAKDLYGKMLYHENYIYRLYAIQGIRLNKFSEFKSILESISKNDKNNNVKKHALSTIDEL